MDLRDEVIDDLELDEAVSHYFRMVQQVSIELLHLDWTDISIAYSREEIFKIATTEAEVVAVNIPELDDKSALVFHQLKSEDFLAWLWVPAGSEQALLENGTIDVLNEGVFVSTDPTAEWLPDCFGFISGVFNFSSGAIDLPVSRDKVVTNRKLSIKKALLAEKALVMIDRLVDLTRGTSGARLAVLALTACLGNADKELRQRIIRRLDQYQAKIFQRDRNTSLLSIREKSPAVVYVEYSQGRLVSQLATFDGRLLYHKAEDLSHLQAALLRQRGEVVLSSERADPGDEKILEIDLLKAYFGAHGVTAVDITKRVESMSKMVVSKPLPSASRMAIGKDNRFVEVDGLPRKRAWKVGKETWFNTANADIGALYQILRSGTVSGFRLKLIEVVFKLLAHNFEEALGSLLVLILEEEEVWGEDEDEVDGLAE